MKKLFFFYAKVKLYATEISNDSLGAMVVVVCVRW